MFNFNKVFLVSAALVVATTVADARMVTRDCAYKIYIKSDAIRSSGLTGGGVVFRGHGGSRKSARTRARGAAYHCLFENGHKPKVSCIQGRGLPRGGGGAVEFGAIAKNWSTQGYAQLCTIARRAGIRVLTNPKIYIKTLSRSRDVRRECTLFVRHDIEFNPVVYATLETKPRLQCAQ